MTVKLVHPEGVNRVDVHHQVADTQGSRTVYLAQFSRSYGEGQSNP